MKKMKETAVLILVMISLNIFSINAQWDAKTPAEQTMTEIQSEYVLPSEKSRPELRARPIDETPIGGINASLHEASYLSLILVLGIYFFIKQRKLRTRQ